MRPSHYVIIGAGAVGTHLARELAGEGHRVTVIDSDPGMRQLVEEQLDVRFVRGNGAHVPVLEAAEVASCDLLIAATSSDEANLAACLLAKRAGAPRCVARVSTSEDVTRYRRIYERAFGADLLLSTELLTTTRVINSVLGYNTVEVEYMAGGAVQLRRTHVEEGSLLHRRPLAEAGLPRGSLVLALITGGRMVVPTGDERAAAGDDALVLATSDVIDEVEKRISGHAQTLGTVVIAGGGRTTRVVASGLARQVRKIKIIERNRERAEALAAEFPEYEILQGDATDMSLLAAEGVGEARAFIALTGNDETNLMACLLAQELGALRLTALVQKSETSSLWRKVGLLDVVSPRTAAAEHIRAYINNRYEPNTVSVENGTARFIQRRVDARSAAAGARLGDIEIPQGLIVAAVLRDGEAIVPDGTFQIDVDDEVMLFVREEEVPMAQLIFPGQEAD